MESRRTRILICDDDKNYHLALKHTLKSSSDLLSAYNTDEAKTLLARQSFDILLLDIQMRTDDEGLAALPSLRAADPELEILMISGITEFSAIREAMRRGANDYVPKDFEPEDLAHTIRLALERRKLKIQNSQRGFESRSEQKKHLLLGESEAMIRLRKSIEKLRTSRANVLITGETGTGKEVVARQLRRAVDDSSIEPFVAVDSSTIQSSTAESLLFGHEKGAFTGADRSTKGLFEEADGGVIYFDELGNMPLEIQSKLLRAIQEKEILRLGSSRPISLEFRVVCATNRDLEEMIRQGQFKDDLYQRLNVLPIHLPPLRERTEDIPILLDHFGKANSADGSIPCFTPEAIHALRAYSWPGNIRELSNVVAYVLAMTEGAEIDLADLPPKIRDFARDSTNSGKSGFYEKISKFEKEILKKAYEEFTGNISQMALGLGMDRSHLYTKLKEHGLHASRSKGSAKTETPN